MQRRGVDQQYPPVSWTHAVQPHLGAQSCTETRSRNLRRVALLDCRLFDTRHPVALEALPDYSAPSGAALRCVPGMAL